MRSLCQNLWIFGRPSVVWRVFEIVGMSRTLPRWISGLITVAMVFTFAITSLAQDRSDNFRRYEAGVLGSMGYQSGRDDFAGGGFSFAVRKSELLAFAADVSSPNADTVEYRFGPRLYGKEISRIAPFVHLLAGGVNVTRSVTQLEQSGRSTQLSVPSENGFALGAGGGIDVRLTPWLVLRPVHLDYSLLRISGDSSNGLRYDLGFVFRFGR